MHALLHASLLRELPLQSMVSGVQLLLQRAFIVLINLSRFLQDVNLQRNHMKYFKIKKSLFVALGGNLQQTQNVKKTN